MASDMIPAPPGVPEPQAAGLREAVIEECAKVAERRHHRWKMPHPDDAKRGEVCDDISACRDIAKAIRALAKTPPQGE